MRSISVIVPVYDEEKSIPYLHGRLVEVLERTVAQWQVVYVDDGSRDGSFRALADIGERDHRVIVVQFGRNFGQTAAIAAGIDHSNGDVIIPLDADLQNDPADIPRLLDKIEEGYDVVSGWRKHRRDPFWSRRLPSLLANSLISSVTGVRLHDYGCTLKAYRRATLEHMRLYGEMHRFIPVHAAWAGARIAELPVNHFARQHGKSKYGIARTIKVVLDLLTVKFLLSYLTKPIYVFGGWGLLLFLFGAVLTAVVAVQKIAYQVFVHRNPLALIAGLSFVAGLQLVLMGLLAEIIVRTYHEAQGKRAYVVRHTINFREHTPNVRDRGVRRQPI